MQLKDARSISPQGQEALRKRAVRAVLNGMKQTAAACTFSVARGTVALWMHQYRQGGEAALERRPQGRPPAPRLQGERQTAVMALIERYCPDQLGLSSSLWTREMVGALIKKRFGLALSVWTVGRYLRRWGLTPQKPARRAYEQDPEGVRHWLEVEYPEIQKQAKAEGAEIHWGDEMGVRSDHQAGRTWSRKGEDASGPGHRPALPVQHHLSVDQPGHPEISGIPGKLQWRSVYRLSAPPGPGPREEGLSYCRPPPSAHFQEGAMVGGAPPRRDSAGLPTPL